MTLALLAALFALCFAGGSILILAFAFRRSTGTGFIVLLIPGYIFYFAFSQFEHRFKPLLLSVWFGSLGLSAVFFALSQSALRATAAPIG